MKHKRFFAAAVVMMLGLAGCGGKVEEETVNTEQTTEQTTTAGESADTEKPRYQMEYDENGVPYLIDNNTDKIIPSFPEGWSGERISKMVTIDGFQLTLPCKVSDILDLSEDFRLDEPFDYGDGTSSYHIWYKDVIAASGIFDNDSNMIETMNIGGNEYTKFESIDSTIPDDVFSFFSDFQRSTTGSINAGYFESGMIYNIIYTGKSQYSSILINWNNIQDVQIGTDF
ncbi:MAG: hypothetical protein K2N72_06035 [Oscillospiraceae bacterium]|nr:hypothetical protein [Oscillospiraceae bacterium]